MAAISSAKITRLEYEIRVTDCDVPRRKVPKLDAGLQPSRQILHVAIVRLKSPSAVFFAELGKLQTYDVRNLRISANARNEHALEVLRIPTMSDDTGGLPRRYRLKLKGSGMPVVTDRLYVGTSQVFSHIDLDFYGISDKCFLEAVGDHSEKERQKYGIRLAMKSLSLGGHTNAVRHIEQDTGIMLEHSLIAHLHDSIVKKANYEAAENDVRSILEEHKRCSSGEGASTSIAWDRTDLPYTTRNMGHSFACVDSTSKASGGRIGRLTSCQFWSYDLAQKKWKDVQGRFGPGVRSATRGSTMACHDASNSIYLCGGLNQYREPILNCYKFDADAGLQKVDLPCPARFGVYVCRLATGADRPQLVFFGARLRPSAVLRTIDDLFKFGPTLRQPARGFVVDMHTMKVNDLPDQDFFCVDAAYNAVRNCFYVLGTDSPSTVDPICHLYEFDAATNGFTPLSYVPFVGLTRCFVDAAGDLLVVVSEVTSEWSLWRYSLQRKHWRLCHESATTSRTSEPRIRKCAAVAFCPVENKLFVLEGPGDVKDAIDALERPPASATGAGEWLWIGQLNHFDPSLALEKCMSMLNERAFLDALSRNRLEAVRILQSLNAKLDAHARNNQIDRLSPLLFLGTLHEADRPRQLEALFKALCAQLPASVRYPVENLEDFMPESFV
ncbi:muskelin-like protein [Aphelenchoides avenae]|nr:muskelin-like protein [Aphelenchus avenae]